MKKKEISKGKGVKASPKDILIKIMKKSLILCLLFSSFTALSFSQKISLKLENAPLGEAFNIIKKKANVNFFYSNNELDVNTLISADFKKTDAVKIVSHLVGDKFDVRMVRKGVILIKPKPIDVQQDKILVTGNITDEHGTPMLGATILIKGSRTGTTTDFDGNYFIKAYKNSTLIFRYVGYKTQEIQVNGQKRINVTMEQSANSLDEVVITGIVNRDKESFTGAVTTVKGDELKAIGNLNVIESLKTIDPSFVVVENSDFGSDPNRLPDIEVRGQTSITGTGLNDEFGGDPNQPLFVLDGFETSLQRIVNLDMNRVASITVLKDAASTALYGAKAANGVVVVETIKPKVGKLFVNYNADFRIQFPDLSDYNLMNAEQKLEFERLSGRWTTLPSFESQQFALDEQYNSILAEVKRGVNTYWLSKPLQTGTSLNHSLRVSGGEEAIRYGIGLNYRDLNGVMIGSGRDTWGADFSLNYRKNKFNVTNHLYISGYDATESPYGNFSDYANANPYYRIRDADGNITKYLDSNTNVRGLSDFDVENPLYQSTLNNKDNTEELTLLNNFNGIFTFNRQWRLQTSFQLKQSSKTRKVFISPDDYQFDGVPIEEQGKYQDTRVKSSGYTFNSMLTYSRVINNKHRINANGRVQFGQTKNERLGIVAVGYPSGTNGNPSFATSYQPDSSPNTAQRLYRRINFLASANYSYDNRYLFDATYRLDGATVFGTNKKFTPFWALGAGWNLHKEFDLDPSKISLLKIRGNIGYTGNQNFGSSASISIYGYNGINNIFGQGLDLSTLANPDLEWQKTFTTSVGIDGAFFNKKLTATFNAYQKFTSPLVVVADLPTSTGVSGYPLNTGDLKTRGLETIIRYSPIFDLEKGYVWTIGLTGSFVTEKYQNFNSTLNSLNDAAQESNSLIRYKDGYSPNDIWAVESLGIDPANGREVFLTAEGTKTYEYNPDDIKVMGNRRPDVEGVISNTVRIKNFSLGINMRYRLGADVFNRALYNKVENISSYGITLNQDVRALTDRWIMPGDIARFKAISLSTSTPISSRFIQKENVLIGESFHVGYDFKDQKWIKNLGLSRLRVRGYTNDIFRLSTVKVERGISYPFARSVSFSLNASF